MNQTYLVSTTNQIELKRSAMKQKLTEIRERSKHLLDKHNWKKYFQDDEFYQPDTTNSSSGCSSMTECLLKKRFSKIVSAIDMDLSSNNDSVDSMIKSQMMPSELSKIVFDASTLVNSRQQSKQESKMFQTIQDTPIRSSKVCSTVYSLRKKIFFDDDYTLDKEVSFYCNNINNNQEQKRIKLDKMKRNDSLTFIADLASTSTPTRTTQQPITSTPKQLSHNPLDYHPTQTIRNKAIKKQSKPFKQAKIAKRFTSSVYSCNDCTDCKKVLKNNKKSILLDSFVSCETCYFRQNEQQIKTTKIFTKFTNVTKRKIMQKQQQPRIKFKSISNNNIQISLGDLLYTPSKLRDLVNTNCNNRSIKSSVAVKSAPVISSTAVAALAKIYYL